MSAAEFLPQNPYTGRQEIPGAYLVKGAAADLAPIIKAAQADANTHGISGKAVTPYLLQRIFELTEGRSLTANIALVRNNARFASKIAAALMSKDA